MPVRHIDINPIPSLTPDKYGAKSTKVGPHKTQSTCKRWTFLLGCRKCGWALADSPCSFISGAGVSFLRGKDKRQASSRWKHARQPKTAECEVSGYAILSICVTSICNFHEFSLSSDLIMSMTCFSQVMRYHGFKTVKSFLLEIPDFLSFAKLADSLTNKSANISILYLCYSMKKTRATQINNLHNKHLLSMFLHIFLNSPGPLFLLTVCREIK